LRIRGFMDVIIIQWRLSVYYPLCLTQTHWRFDYPIKLEHDSAYTRMPHYRGSNTCIDVKITAVSSSRLFRNLLSSPVISDRQLYASVASVNTYRTMRNHSSYFWLCAGSRFKLDEQLVRKGVHAHSYTRACLHARRWPMKIKAIANIDCTRD